MCSCLDATGADLKPTAKTCKLVASEQAHNFGFFTCVLEAELQFVSQQGESTFLHPITSSAFTVAPPPRYTYLEEPQYPHKTPNK